MSYLLRLPFSLKSIYPYYVGKSAVINETSYLPVVDKYTQREVSRVSTPQDKKEIARIFGVVQKSQKSLKTLQSFERKNILSSIAQQLQQRQEELAHILVLEVGKSITDARGEVGRAIETFTISAEESVRQNGVFTRADNSVRNQGISYLTSRFPIGLISMIVPFNFPFNLAAHKIGPAIAVGCPFVLKPSERTPLSASVLGEILANTALPEDSYAILPTQVSDASVFSEDERIKMISFTGSSKIGWQIKAVSHKKKVALELGGTAVCIIDNNTNLDYAVNRTFWGAFYSNGQSCISVQKIYVHEEIYEPFLLKLVDKARGIVMGDPYQPTTFLGPLIHESEAIRLENWLKEAQKEGARVLIGGNRNGAFFEPTIIENVPNTAKLSCQEAFGPICIVEKFKDIPSVIDNVNRSEYGLQAGIFTNDIHKSFYAYNNLEVGGVVINDVPSVRVDAMPYGGIKESGMGREGIVYAMEEMTELKVMVFKDLGKL